MALYGLIHTMVTCDIEFMHGLVNKMKIVDLAHMWRLRFLTVENGSNSHSRVNSCTFCTFRVESNPLHVKTGAPE
jgi:hypothetical protein